jgi:DNA-binding CsgD family transcriptional regulator
MENIPYEPISHSENKGILKKRVERLSGDEAQVYKWLREQYSERWITETLLLDKRRTREIIWRVCRKLGVPNVKAMLRMYNRLKIPGTGVVRTEKIDAYVDARIDKEIEAELRKPEENAQERDKSPPGQ